MIRFGVFLGAVIIALASSCLLAADPPLGAIPIPPAQPPEFAREADKAQLFMQIAKKMNLEDASTKAPYCRQLLSDLQTMNEITFVEPTVRASTFDDPTLKTFRQSWEHCGVMPFNRVIDVKYKELDRGDYLDQIGAAYYVSANISIYSRRDLDSSFKGKNEDAFIFYGERNCTMHFGCTVGLAYDFVNSKQCKRPAIAAVFDSYDYGSKEKSNAQNAVVRQKNKIYVISFAAFKTGPLVTRLHMTPVNVSAGTRAKVGGCSFESVEY